MRKLISLLFFLTAISLFAQIKAVWVPIWEITTAEKVDRVIEDMIAMEVNQLLIQIRYRGDAAYTPNRISNLYHNTEKKYYAIKDSLFDPLDYLLSKKNITDLEIFAWLPTFVITGHELENLHPDHIYFKHPEWITCDFSQEMMDYKVDMGAYLDPGIPEVRGYIRNVVLDLVTNYPLDGIHFDYIRYPDTHYGFSKLALEMYRKDVKFRDADSWKEWKEAQVTNFMKNIYHDIKRIAPKMEVTAAVISNLDEAERYSQNWIKWLQEGFLDRAYLMEYSTSTSTIEKHLNYLSNYDLKEKIIVGLRCWSTAYKYPAYKINEKIKLISKTNYHGYALFSYTGIRESEYFKDLKIK
ncbi:MAG: family 10 glycosylhydrolase [Candidatus Cloacimonetes bacterium]|nr:family 10 glycosylhydrolase [Candidatus Cloacimonadota bacterium]